MILKAGQLRRSRLIGTLLLLCRQGPSSLLLRRRSLMLMQGKALPSVWHSQLGRNLSSCLQTFRPQQLRGKGLRLLLLRRLGPVLLLRGKGVRLLLLLRWPILVLLQRKGVGPLLICRGLNLLRCNKMILRRLCPLLIWRQRVLRRGKRQGELFELRKCVVCCCVLCMIVCWLSGGCLTFQS
jgi:hypothetical protein